MVAHVTLLCWKNIPTQVKATDESGGEHSVALDGRFQEAVDALAMRQGLAGTDEYLEHWVSSEPEERLGTAEEAAETVAQELERAWPREVPAMLQRALGEHPPAASKGA